MSNLRLVIVFWFFTLAFAVGCVQQGGVATGTRSLPSYASSRMAVPKHVRIAVYPVDESGTEAERIMNGIAYEFLYSGLVDAGYDVLPKMFSGGATRGVCVVEIANCRNDIREWSGGFIASLVTVVAVRVRRPGILRNGRIDCGRARAFQGVCRMRLGQRRPNFVPSMDENVNGVKGAVDNLIHAKEFVDAVMDCVAVP